MSSIIHWTNSSRLTKDSQMYSQDCNLESFFYEAFEVKVPENRYYTIWSSSNIDTYGYIYENSFDPLDPFENLLTSNDDSEGYGDQFKIETHLYDDTRYILIVTTYSPKQIGDITINILGLKNVTVTRHSK
jgi:hypothetical protein